MKILVACLDQEYLWVIDDWVGGLYSIDRKTLETRCVIDCLKLFPYGKFNVLSLFEWKKDYIVLVPMEADKNWIIYNKITGKIEYRKVIEKKCQEILIAVDQERNQIYFFPFYIYGPILIVDLNTLTCLQMIEDWSSRIPSNCSETAWKGVYDGQYMFFPIQNTKILVRMDCDTREVKLLELNISENLIDVDYAVGELWVLPTSGNCLYQIDENGQIIKIVELMTRDDVDSLPNFARIIVQKRYLFLLPYYREGIYIYDKLKRKTDVILKEDSDLKEKEKEIYLRYWIHYVKENQICFLPFGDNYIEIDLDTLTYIKKTLSYPNIWSDEEKIQRIIWNHIPESNPVLKEADGCDLKIFLKYMQYEKNSEDLSENKHTGKIVWDMLYG